jgi:chromosome partitioning protein
VTAVEPFRLAVTNQKGGVGKTTTAVSLAAALAGLGHVVLLLDLDPQGNASTGLGVGARDRGFSTYHLIGDPPPGYRPPVTPLPNLHIIPASPDLAGAEVELAGRPERERGLARGLAAWLASHARVDPVPPELVILDCPPSLGLLTVNALAAADAVLVPLQCEFFALEGLAQLLGTLERIRGGLNPRLALSGVLLTMFDRRNNLSELVAADVRGFLGAKVFETMIPRNVRISEAPSHGQPITTYDPRSPGAQAYIRLAAEFLARQAAARAGSASLSGSETVRS